MVGDDIDELWSSTFKDQTTWLISSVSAQERCSSEWDGGSSVLYGGGWKDKKTLSFSFPH